MWLTISAGPSWLPRTQTTRISSRSVVAADDLQAGEMPLREPLEVEVVEDVAVDDQLTAVLDRPGQELFEELRLADVAAQVQIADHDAVVKGPLARICKFEAVSITRLPRSLLARQGHVLIWRLHPGLPESP